MRAHLFSHRIPDPRNSPLASSVTSTPTSSSPTITSFFRSSSAPSTANVGPPSRLSSAPASLSPNPLPPVKSTDELITALLVWVLCANLPFSSVEHPQFKELLSRLTKVSIPSRRSLVRRLEPLYVRVKSAVVRDLAQQPVLALGFDFYKNRFSKQSYGMYSTSDGSMLP